MSHKNNLLLHCGSSAVEREQLWEVVTPEPTDTWQPIAHHDLLSQVEHALGGQHLEIVNEAHGLSRDGTSYFGLIQVARTQPIDLGVSECIEEKDFGYVVGVRNNHTKRFPAGICAGSSVFVCDNLAFSSEITVNRKHTVFIKRDLPGLTAQVIGKLSDKWNDQETRFEGYKQHELNEPRAHDLLIKALDCRAITATQIPHILKEYRTPRHPEFSKDGFTVWRFFNACTEVAKDSGIWALPSRTIALQGLLDQEAGIIGLN